LTRSSLDLFAQQNLRIDYAHHKITLGWDGAARRSFAIQIYTAAGAPYIVLPVTVQGHLLRLLLDTGTNGLTLFAHRSPSRVLNQRGSPNAARDPMGEVKTHAVEPLDLRIGQQFFRNVPGMEVRRAAGSVGPD
jgi:hypothetical protein